MFVALRKESVDRNHYVPQDGAATQKSLSARRAWIEIMFSWTTRPLAVVALRKESVDRNLVCPKIKGALFGSLSARRAWIEIPLSKRLR